MDFSEGWQRGALTVSVAMLCRHCRLFTRQLLSCRSPETPGASLKQIAASWEEAVYLVRRSSPTLLPNTANPWISVSIISGHNTDCRFIPPQSNPVMFLCILLLHLSSLLVTASPDQVVGGLLVLGRRGEQRSCHLVWGTHTQDPELPGLCNTPSLAPPSKQSISVVLQGKHIYWLVTARQCGSSGPVAEGISLGRGQGENGGN